MQVAPTPKVSSATSWFLVVATGVLLAGVGLVFPLLAEIPLETPLRAACDEGRPGVLSQPGSASSRAFAALAAAVA